MRFQEPSAGTPNGALVGAVSRLAPDTVEVSIHSELEELPPSMRARPMLDANDVVGGMPTIRLC